MDGFGGDGTRDFFPEHDPYSPSHSTFSVDGSHRQGSCSALRLQFDGLDLNTEDGGFPLSWEYPRNSQTWTQSGGGGGFVGGGTDGARGSASRRAWPSQSLGVRLGRGAAAA